jgi:hypothetical protein
MDTSVPVIRTLFTSIEDNTGILSTTLPVIETTFTGLTPIEGDIDLAIPLFLIQSLFSPSDYINMVMNLRNQALTTYKNYKFNSMCRFNGRHYGATATKIYDLDIGLTDEGTEIEWNFRLGYIDLEQKIKKRIAHAWMSYKSDGDLIATIITPEGDEWEYPVTAVNNTENGIRVGFGKGIKSKYVALDIKNVDGSNIVLDTIRLNFDRLEKQR